MLSKKTFVTGLAAGAAVGAAAGLLLAPRTGKETRKIVAGKIGELRRRAESRCCHQEEYNGQHPVGSSRPSQEELAA